MVFQEFFVAESGNRQPFVIVLKVVADLVDEFAGRPEYFDFLADLEKVFDFLAVVGQQEASGGQSFE